MKTEPGELNPKNGMAQPSPAATASDPPGGLIVPHIFLKKNNLLAGSEGIPGE